MVTEFTNENVTVTVEKKVVGIVELPLLTTWLTKNLYDFGRITSCVEYLNAMITGISN